MNKTLKTCKSSSQSMHLHSIKVINQRNAFIEINFARHLKGKQKRVDLSAVEWISQLKKWLICQFLMFHNSIQASP